MTLISAGDRLFSLVVHIGGTRLPDWACVKFAEMLRFGVQGIGYAGQLSRRSAPVSAADGPARQASPRMVT